MFSYSLSYVESRFKQKENEKRDNVGKRQTVEQKGRQEGVIGVNMIKIEYIYMKISKQNT